MRSIETCVALLAVAGLAAVAGAESRIERRFPLASGARFELATDVGQVSIRGGSGREAVVKISSNGRDLDRIFNLEFDPTPSKLRIRARQRHHFHFFSNDSDRVSFEIELPAETETDVRTSGGAISVSGLARSMKASTSGGRLDIRDVNASVDGSTSGGGVRAEGIVGDCRLASSGGRIEARNIRGKLDAESSGGSIIADRISGDLSIESSGGPLEIEEAAGRVEASTSGGSVDVRLARGNARGGRIESSGGSIQAELDPTISLEVDASAEEIRSDLPLRTESRRPGHHLRGVLGDGGELLRLSTSGGTIHLRPR